MSVAGRTTRFPISFDGWYAALSSLLFLPPSSAYVEVDPVQVQARMGWAFRTRFARSAVVSAAVTGMSPISRGVHGFAGRWLVNGSADGIVSIRLEPAQRAYLLGFPIRLRELLVSVANGSALVAALREPPHAG